MYPTLGSREHSFRPPKPGRTRSHVLVRTYQSNQSVVDRTIYLQPWESAWTSVLDEFILKATRGGKLQYPEERPIGAMGLTVAQKRAILKRMPTKRRSTEGMPAGLLGPEARDSQVEGWEGIDGESPWHGPRTECIRRGVSYHDIQYYKNTGTKWYRWYSRQHYKRESKSIPIRFRERKLIDSEATAEYSLAAPLQMEYRTLWPASRPP